MIAQILTMIAEITGRSAEEYHAKDNLITDIGLSSFEIIQLIARIEEAYQIRISTQELSGFTTPQSIVDYLQGKKNG